MDDVKFDTYKETATASRLVEKGLEVRTDLTGRTAASAERAAKAGNHAPR